MYGGRTSSVRLGGLGSIGGALLSRASFVLTVVPVNSLCFVCSLQSRQLEATHVRPVYPERRRTPITLNHSKGQKMGKRNPVFILQHYPFQPVFL
jgi:hypothetical protein